MVSPMNFARSLGLSALLLALLAVVPGTSAATDIMKVPTATGGRLRIVAFGSSSTEGVGASTPAHSYPSMLQADLQASLPRSIVASVINLGHGGDDSQTMLARVPAVLAEHPDLVIWQTGTNDSLHGLSLERFVILTEAGLDNFEAAHLPVMLIEPQWCQALVNHPESLGYRDTLRRIARERGIPIVLRYDLMQEWLARGLVTLAQLQSGDGLHMGDGGYALLAQTIAGMIVPAPLPRAVTATR